ncbi:MAG: hypothetical protein V1824_03330, partial [archaeon]
MKLKYIFVILCMLFFLNQIFALDCQYQETVLDRTGTKIIAYSIDTDDPIEPITSSLAGTEKAPLYFFNENDFNVDIEYDLSYRCNGYDKSNHYSRTLIHGTNEVGFFCISGYFKSLSNLAYRENAFVSLKSKEERVYKEICKVCGTKNCLNDGIVCSINSDCGSNFCVRGICSNFKDGNCYNNDCNCSIDEIEFDNKDCIAKHSVSIGGKPITNNSEECISNYISTITGNCAIALGDSCNQELDCGGNYCVMNKCSDKKNICYQNNCNCKEDEIQFNNKDCVKKQSVETGIISKTGDYRECIS